MSQTRRALRSVIKWSCIAAVAILFLSLSYLVFFLPESVDHTFNLSNKRELTVYHSSNIDFGYDPFEGGGRKGYRIKAGHLRLRFEEPDAVLSYIPF